MTCVDFGDTNCLCRPIRVMVPDSDRAFGDCIYRECAIVEVEGTFPRGLT